MIDECTVPRQLLLDLYARCAWPAIRVGSAVLLADEGAWRYAVSRSTPSERVQLLLSLKDELLRASPGGAARLAGARHRHADIDELPYVRGDEEALAIVAAAFALLPEEVRWQLQKETAFASVGRSSRAWTSTANFIDVAGRRKSYLVALGPDADVRTVLHECAHVWAAGPPRPDATGISVQGEHGLAALAVKDGWSGKLTGWERAEEQLAEGLALAWLLGAPDSTPS